MRCRRADALLARSGVHRHAARRSRCSSSTRSASSPSTSGRRGGSCRSSCPATLLLVGGGGADRRARPAAVDARDPRPDRRRLPGAARGAVRARGEAGRRARRVRGDHPAPREARRRASATTTCSSSNRATPAPTCTSSRCRWPTSTRATSWCSPTPRRTRRCSRRSSTARARRYRRVLFLGGGGTDLLSSRWSVTPLAERALSASPSTSRRGTRIRAASRLKEFDYSALRVRAAAAGEPRPCRPRHRRQRRSERHPLPRQGADRRDARSAGRSVSRSSSSIGSRAGDRDAGALDERRRTAGGGAAGGRHAS